MRVYRNTYRDADGVRREAANWYVEFRDQNGQPKRLPAFTDKRQSEELGRNLDRLVVYRQTAAPPDPTLSRWLQALPAKLQDYLVGLELLDRERAAGNRPLSDHLADFKAGMQADGRHPRHVQWTEAQIRQVLDGCHFKFWPDVSAGKVQTFLADLRKRTEIKQRTYNGYVTAVTQFATWAVNDGRIPTHRWPRSRSSRRSPTGRSAEPCRWMSC